jgi:hypothetical protein
MSLLEQLTADLPEGFEFSNQDREFIAMAEAQQGDISRLEASLADQETFVDGSAGNQRLNFLFAELRQMRNTRALILARVKIPQDSPSSKTAHGRWQI